jgi:hypothetical protein
MNLEQLRRDLINLTALHYRVLLAEDAKGRSALDGEIPATIDNVMKEIARIEQEVPAFRVVFSVSEGEYGLFPKK